MYSLLPLVLFYALILGTHSAVFRERQHTVTGHEGECHDKVDDTFYKIGEEMKWRSKECGRKICLGYKRDQVLIETQTCGKVGVPPGCHTEVNLDLPYPDCCERIVCQKPMDSNVIDSGFSNWIQIP